MVQSTERRKGMFPVKRVLAPKDVRDIRRRRQRGEEVKAIAERYAVSKVTVYNILKGVAYANVD